MIGISFVAGLFGVLMCVADDRKVTVSFDALFPQTHYTMALDACMQVWADLEALLISRDDVSPEDRELLFHAAVGRMAYSDVCLELVVQDPLPVPANDLLYLVRALDMIEDRCAAFTHQSDNIHMRCFKRLLADVRKKLRLLMAKVA